MGEQVNQVNFLNWWSLIHFCFWFVVGFAAWKKAKADTSLGKVLLLSLLGAYAWEVVEYFIGAIPALWPLTESAVNRWVSDPLMALIAVPLAWWLAKASEGSGYERRQHA